MSDDDPIFCGVTLEQHAGVSAAVAEEIPLSEVLSQEGIPEPRWQDANRKWRAAIADGPELQTKYLQKRRLAEDCLRRPIEPLDDDAASWVGLLAAVNAADDAKTVLGPLGLRATDLARLGRHWNKKAQQDPAVTKKLTDLAGKAAAPKSVRAEAARLKPFPWTAAAGAPQAASSQGAPRASDAAEDRETAALATPRDGVLPAEDSLDLYAALSVVLQLRPDGRAVALALCGLDESRMRSLLASWRRRLDGEPELHAEFTVRSADHRAAFRRLLAGAAGSMER